MAAMFAPSKGSKALRHAIPASPTVTLPRFLVPAWQTSKSGSQQQQSQLQQPRSFSTTTHCASKLGRTPISVPPGVEISLGEPRFIRGARDWKSSTRRTITVKGPLGELTLEIPDFVKMQQDAEAKTATLSILNVDEKTQHEMWGTSWSYLNNHITGVSEGHSAILRLVGVGYRASVEQRGMKQQYPGQQFLCMKLGFTHPVEEGIPKGVKVTTPSPTRILLEGTDKEALMSFAGRIKQWRKPEPYKGKGIFINDETIKLKSKKIS